MALPWIIPRAPLTTDDLLSLYAEQISASAPSPPGSERTSNTNLYIKGIGEDFSNQKLRDLVPDQSQIKSVKAATDEDDTKCRGYGFIDFHTEEAANEALRFIQKNHPSFTVKFAKENEKDETNLYVTNIPKTWTTKDSDRLKEIFEKYGPIQSAFIMVERSTNRITASAPYQLRRSGVGFVRFANKEDALKSLEGLRNSPVILPGCTAPVEAKFADKHNPESRRRRVAAAQINGAVRGALPAGAQIPLLQQPAQMAAYPQSIYSALYGYRHAAANPSPALTSPAAASPYSASYPIAAAAAYGGLNQAQTLLTTSGNGLYQLSPSQSVGTSAVPALSNGSPAENGSIHSAAFQQLILPNGLATGSSTLPSVSYGACLDYTAAAAAAQGGYPYVLQAAHHADH